MNINELRKQKWFIPAAVVVGIVVLGALVRGFGERSAERAIEDAIEGDADVDYNSDGTVRVRTDQGEFSTGNELPDNWPSDVPVYAGAKVVYSASSNPSTGESGVYVALQSSASVSTVAEYYGRELPGKGWKVTNTASAGGATYLTAEKDGRQLSLSMSPAEGGSSIIIGVAERE